MQTESILIPDDLFHDAKAGDPGAISALWDACVPLLTDAVRQSRVSALSTAEAADVAQEAARHFLETLRGEECESGATLVRFLATSLRYRLYSYLRAERRRQNRQVVPQADDLERAMARSRVPAGPGRPPGRQLTRALERLSPRQRAVIAGLYFRDRSVKSLSDELGVTPQAVTAVHRRALQVLREILEVAETTLTELSPDE